MNTASSPEVALLERTLNTLATRTGFPITFGGFAEPTGTELTRFTGTRTGSLRGLVIKPGQGLGGLALSRRQLTATDSYHETTEIIHSYDREVGGEGILSLLAVPVVVDGQVRALLYAGLRERQELANETLAVAAREAQRLAWELSVHEETQRRVAVLRASDPRTAHLPATAPSQDDLAVLYAELRDIARQITDSALAERLITASQVLQPLHNMPSLEQKTSAILSPRELDVVAHLALGKRNALIATHMGVAESTVKSYLASAVRKLEAGNRFDVVLRARSRGLIP